MNGVNEQLGK